MHASNLAAGSEPSGLASSEAPKVIHQILASESAGAPARPAQLGSELRSRKKKNHLDIATPGGGCQRPSDLQRALCRASSGRA
ncbi:unnamed protein product [Lampetra fluviatilis]